jgi:hypothetical protein
MSVQDPFSVALRPQHFAQQLEMEEAATENMFVIMSDIQLDKPLVSKYEISSCNEGWIILLSLYSDYVT